MGDDDMSDPRCQKTTCRWRHVVAGVASCLTALGCVGGASPAGAAQGRSETGALASRTAPAPAGTPTLTPGGELWGADSADSVQSELGTLETDAGGAKPAFWGQYLYTYSFKALTATEAKQDLADGISLLLLVQDDQNDPNNTLGTAKGTAEGKAAVSAAAAIGVPAGVGIFKDIEQSSSVNASFVEAWYKAVSAGGYAPGLYGNPVNGQFSGAYCAAVSSDPAVGNTEIDSSEYEPLFKTKPSPPSKAPGWSNSAWPSCTAKHAVWQYDEPEMSGQPDEDEASTSAPLWSATTANGSFVTYQGAVYRIAGGAPMYVSSWSVFGGAKPTTAVTSSQWSSLAKVPANGTFVNAEQTGDVYVIAGGAPLYVSSWSVYGGAKPLVTIDNWDITNAGKGPLSHLNAVPAEGTFVNALTSARNEAGAFVIVGGAPLWISSWSVYGTEPSLVTIDIWDITNAGKDARSHLNKVPANGTIVNALTSSRAEYGAFVIAGGAPLWISSWSVYGGEPTPLTTVDAWDVKNAGNVASHLNKVPANGTFLKEWDTSKLYRTAGGYPFLLDSCKAIGGCGSSVVVSPWDFAHKGATISGLSKLPKDGTVVRCEPSGTYWKFEAGKRSTTKVTASAVRVNNSSVDGFRVGK